MSQILIFLEKIKNHADLMSYGYFFYSTVRSKKKCPSLIFEYLQKLQELALDIYGAFTQTLEVFADIILMVEISILVEISTINPQLKGSKSAGK